MSDPRECVTCGKKLRSNSVGDECFRCRLSAGRAESAPRSRPSREAPPSDESAERDEKALRDQFDMLARGLGKDPAKLIGDFCEGWIANIKEAADKALGATE